MDKSSTKRYLRQGSSLDLKNVVQMDMKNESRVLVLYTGGTIGNAWSFFRSKIVLNWSNLVLDWTKNERSLHNFAHVQNVFIQLEKNWTRPKQISL